MTLAAGNTQLVRKEKFSAGGEREKERKLPCVTVCVPHRSFYLLLLARPRLLATEEPRRKAPLSRLGEWPGSMCFKDDPDRLVLARISFFCRHFPSPPLLSLFSPCARFINNLPPPLFLSFFSLGENVIVVVSRGIYLTLEAHE